MPTRKGRERNDSGRYVGTLSVEAVRDAVKTSPDPIATTKEVADALGCSREAARLKLTDLASEGRVDRRNVGAKAIVWWVPGGDPGDPDETIDARLKRLSNELGEPITVGSVVYEDGDRHTLDETDHSAARDSSAGIDSEAPESRPEPSGASDDLGAAIDATGLDPERREALRAMYEYLAEHGTARKSDFTGDVFPDYPAGYGSPGGWWNRLGKDALATLPNVIKPSEGRPTWRFDADETIQEVVPEVELEPYDADGTE